MSEVYKGMIKAAYQDLKKQADKPENNKISVIVSVYNLQAYIERAVLSICSQTYKNLEIILVDDGSTDRSGRICEEYAKKDRRIRVIYKANGGVSSARNAGIEAATGEWITFVDGDDWIDEQMYEDMLRAIQTYDADIAVCNYKRISEAGVNDSSTQDIVVWSGRETLKVFIEEEEEFQIQNAAWNKMYKRSLMGNLRFSEGKLFEDIAYTTRLLAGSGKCVYLNKAYYNYTTDRSDSIMNSKKLKKILTDQVTAYEEKGRFLKEIGEEELYKIHQYFFYKRMLLHYRETKEQKPEGYQEFLKGIAAQIGKKPQWEVYEGQPKGEYVRMRLFVISPGLYYYFTVLNEKYIVPYKQLKLSQGQPLVVVQLSGGMGNQMFQYALYLQLKALGRNVKIDDKTEYSYEGTRPLRLSVFGVKYVTPTREEMLALTDSYMDMVSRVRRKLTGRKTAEYREKSTAFDSQVLQAERAYLAGYWQSEKYFKEIKEQVREAFSFQNIELTEQMKQYEYKIQNCNSVSLHVRRGDYLEVDEVFGGICTEAYYEEAIRLMEQQIPDCQFFVFTNDVSWVKENMKRDNITVVEGNDEDSGYIDMYLMTQCKHYILANSSFSWWGCYLNPSKGKKVIAPNKWWNGKDSSDIYSEEMKIRL